MGGDVREKDESAAKVKPAQPGQEVHFKSTNVPTLSGKSILRWQYCCADSRGDVYELIGACSLCLSVYTGHRGQRQSWRTPLST
jgi:hypothetical protein